LTEDIKEIKKRLMKVEGHHNFPSRGLVALPIIGVCIKFGTDDKSTTKKGHNQKWATVFCFIPANSIDKTRESFAGKFYEILKDKKYDLKKDDFERFGWSWQYACTCPKTSRNSPCTRRCYEC
jgi:hypothetical protein